MAIRFSSIGVLNLVLVVGLAGSGFAETGPVGTMLPAAMDSCSPSYLEIYDFQVGSA